MTGQIEPSNNTDNTDNTPPENISTRDKKSMTDEEREYNASCNRLRAYYASSSIIVIYFLFFFWPFDDSKSLNLQTNVSKQDNSAAPNSSPPKNGIPTTSTSKPSPTPSPLNTSVPTPIVTVSPSPDSTPLPKPTASPSSNSNIQRDQTPLEIFKDSLLGSRSDSFRSEKGIWIAVLLSAFLGGIIHGYRSLNEYIGTKKYAIQWNSRYYAIPIISSILGLGCYFLIRGGILSLGAKIDNINPYSSASISFLVGLFSDQTVEKLKEVSETIFKKPDDPTKKTLPTPDSK